MTEIKEKRVNIYAANPVTIGFGVPRVGTQKGIVLTVEEIRNCLRSHARVEEILPGNRIVPLDFTNFDKDNEVKTEITKQAPVINIVNADGKIVEKTKDETTSTVDNVVEEETMVHTPDGCDPLSEI
mgnify:CR=1 FL=1